MLKKPKYFKVFAPFDTTYYYSRAVAEGIANYININREWLICTPLTYCVKRKNPKEILNWICKLKPDGCIIPNSLGITEPILKMNIPVIVHRDVGFVPDGVATLLGNGQAMGSMAAEHLISKGFKNLAYCSYNVPPHCFERGEGFRKAALEDGIEIHDYKRPRKDIENFWHLELKFLSKWLTSLPKPIGILAFNDDRGRDIIQACFLAGLSVPEEVAVIGIGNYLFTCETAHPKLSSIALSNEEAGYRAAELLDKLMKSKESRSDEKIFTIPTHVITRQSTDILAIDDKEVARMMRFIRENSHKKIDAGDVINETYLSRNGLDKKFKKLTGRSVKDLITSFRVNHIKDRLRGTDMTVSEIAHKLDFVDVSNLWRYFKKNTGMTPLEYRRRYARGNSVYNSALSKNLPL